MGVVDTFGHRNSKVSWGLFTHVQLFPAFGAFWFSEKITLCKTRVSRTALMIHLAQKSPTTHTRTKIRLCGNPIMQDYRVSHNKVDKVN